MRCELGSRHSLLRISHWKACAIHVFQVVLALVATSSVSAQDAASDTLTADDAGTVATATDRQSKPAITADDSSQSSGRGSFVIAPIPTSSPAIGTGATVLGGYIFSLRRSDKVSPSSVLGGGWVEYRRVLRWRIGVAAFGGIGEVGPEFAQFDYENLLPSGGLGSRFMLSSKYHVNLRADFAWGKTGNTFSMGLGESF